VKDNEDRKWIQLAQNRVLWWVMECAPLNLLVVTASPLGSTPSFGLGLLRVVTQSSVFSLPATVLTEFERVPSVVCPAADFVGKPLERFAERSSVPLRPSCRTTLQAMEK
jgi:hypothetical protein